MIKTNKINDLNMNCRAVEVPLLDLVELFEKEALKVCYTDMEARILAQEALRDFLNTYGKNVVVC